MELKTKNTTKRQKSYRLVDFLVFNSAFGRHSNLLIPSTISSIGDRYGKLILSVTIGDRLWWSHQIRITSPWRSPYDDIVLGINKLLCLPKAELKTKNSTKRQLCCRLVEFLVFNSAFGRHSNLLVPSTISSKGDRYGEVILIWWLHHRRSPMVTLSW